jgi:hypothetical protein
MMTAQIKNPRTPGSVVVRFLHDDRGSISIEFIIVLPLLLFLTTGGLTYWDAFHSNSRTAKVAYTISDIMSRHDVVDNVDMAYLFDLLDKMVPVTVDRRSLRISSICFEDGQYRVLWSFSSSSGDVAVPDALEDEDIPLAIMPAMEPQDSVLFTEVEARWQPPFLNVGLGDKTWHSGLISRPRFVKIISHTNLNPSKICPSAT